MLENTLLYECTASTTLAFNSWLLQARILNSCTSVQPVFHGLTLYSNGLVLATHSCTAGSSGVYSSGLVPAGIIIMYKLYNVHGKTVGGTCKNITHLRTYLRYYVCTYMRIAGKIHYCTVPYVSKRDKLRVMMIIYCIVFSQN